MKLYEVPRNTDIDVSLNNFIDEDTGEKIETIHFSHIDGMYSYCTWKGKVIHLSASTEVKII